MEKRPRDGSYNTYVGGRIGTRYIIAIFEQTRSPKHK